MSHHKRTLLPIGIHLGAEGVHMAQMDQADGSVQLVSKASVYFPQVSCGPLPSLDSEGEVDEPADEEDDAGRELALSFIRKKMAANGFRGKDVVISLPSRQLTIQHVRLGTMQPEEVAATLTVELRGKLPFDPQQAVVRHIVAGTVSENNEAKQDVIALAARRSVIEKHVAEMGRIGLQVVGVGAEPCAMCHVYAFAATHGPASQEGPPSLMIVHLGFRTIQVAILRGHETTFVKEVDQGTRHLARWLAKTRKTGMADALALRAKWCESPTPENITASVEAYNSIRPVLAHLTDELESCMRYHSSLTRGAHVDRLYFVGPDARDRGLVRVLGSNLTVPSDLGDPIGTLAGREDPQQAEPELAVSVGLSLFSAE